MLFIAKYDASHYFLINSDYTPFKCGVDICFNKSHVTANLHDGTVNYYARTEVFKDYAMYQVKHFFKEDIKTSLNILWISPYATGYGGELMVEEELIC